MQVCIGIVKALSSCLSKVRLLLFYLDELCFFELVSNSEIRYLKADVRAVNA